MLDKILFLQYESLNSRNTTEGLHVLLQYANDVTNGIFINMFLFAIFVIVLFGTYYSSRRLTGQGNAPASFATAGFITSGAVLIMFVIPNLVTLFTVSVVITVTLIGIIWLFFTNKESA